MAISTTLFGTTRSIPQTGNVRYGAQLSGIIYDLVRFCESLGNLESGVGIAALSAASTELSASGTLTPTASLHRVYSDGGAVTLDGTTAIADGSKDGQILVVEGTSDTNTVKIPTGANTDLNGSITLTQGDVIYLAWNDTRSLWVEIHRNS